MLKGLKFFWIIACLFFCSVGFASELHTHYQINLDLSNFDYRQYPMKVKAEVTNQSKQNVDHLAWMFYPNRYQKILKGINDINLERVYITGYSLGELKIKHVQVNDEGKNHSIFTPMNQNKHEHIFVKQSLDQPLKPDESVVINFDLILSVPEKLGPYGWYKEQLTLSGGWSPIVVSYKEGQFLPYAQMPEASWDIKINTNKDTSVVSPQNMDHEKKQYHFGQNRHVSLKVGEHDHFKIQKNDHHFNIYHQEKKDTKYKEIFKTIAKNFSNFIDEHYQLQEKNFYLAQAPLREMLTVDGTPISYFSDRSFKLIKVLHHFHAIPIYKSLFMQWLEQPLSKIENEKDVFWVRELIAWKLTDDLVESLKVKYRDAREMGVMQFFKFLPLIDRVLYTPQFAFYDVFYNLPYPKDPVRDEVKRFSRKQPFGLTVLAHMEDEFGKDEVHNLIQAYLQEMPKEGFRQFTQRYFDQNLQDRFKQWVSPRPQINYVLSKQSQKKQGDVYKNYITVVKESSSEIIEPVEVKVTYKDKTSKTKIWKSEESEHTFEFSSDQKVKSVEIDPRSRLLETDKSDNRRPAYWKFVVMSMYVDYDIKEKEPLFLLQGQFRKRYGGLDRFDIGAYSQFNAYGANVGYVRLFGETIDALRLSHGFRAAFNVNGLVEDTATVILPQGPTQIDVSPSGFASDLSLAYIFGNQLSYTNPLRGSYGNLTLRLGGPAVGSDFSYQTLTFSIAGIVPIHPNHLWGTRFYFGSAGFHSIPSQLQYRLGGLTTMKGLPLTDNRFIGRHMTFMTNEYRHFWIKDMDVNLGLFRVRRLQGALFSSVGHVTHTVQEQADYQEGLISDRSGFLDLFDLRDWQMDAGYGLRFFVDYLGISPSLISFDVARSINEFDLGWRFYIGVNQSF